MVSLVVAILTCLGIGALLWIDRGEGTISPANWIPTAWLLIFCSRPVSNWMTLGSPVNGFSQYEEGSPLDRNILTLLMALAVVALYKRSRRVMAILNANGPLLLFFGFCALSALWADFPLVLLKRWLRSLGDILMIMVIVTDPNWTEALKRVLMRVGYILIPLSILFIRFYPSMGRAYTYSGVPMWTGVATDKNALGMLCMLLGVSLMWRGSRIVSDRGTKSRTRQLLTVVILLGMVLYLLAVVNSQTALACFLMGSVIIVFTVVKLFRRPAILSLVVASMFSVSYAVLFLGVGSSAIASLGRNASLTGRTEVWQAVLPFAVNPWIGAGYENFWIGERLQPIFEAVGTGLNQAHNGYIEIYLNIGYVGLALLAFVVATGYWNIMRAIRTEPEMSRLKLAFFFMCMVYNFTEASFKMGSPVWLLFLWAAMKYPKVVPKRMPSPVYAPEVATPAWSEASGSLRIG